MNATSFFFFLQLWATSKHFLRWRCSGIMTIWLGLRSNIWSSTSYSVVLNLMPDKIASFPFKWLEGEEPNESKGPKPVVFLFLNEQWIRKRLHVETRCFLPNAIFDVLGKSSGLLCLPGFWPMQQDYVPREAFSVVLPFFFFFFPAFYLNLSQRNAIGVMVSRTKSECCTPNSFHAFIDWNEKNKEKSGVKNRIDLNIPHIIVKMRNQGHVSCSGNIVVCVNLLYNHLMPPVFTVKVDFLEYKCTILFPFC